MRLDLADAERLPLNSAVLDATGAMLARTPEWTDPLPGAAPYRLGANQLVVNPFDPEAPPARAAVDRLLRELDTAVMAVQGDEQRALAVLAASLRLVVGRTALNQGSVSDAMQLVKSAVATRLAVEVQIDAAEPDSRLQSPEVIALILTQFAVNATVHDHAGRLRLSWRDDCMLMLSWDGYTKTAGRVTARSRGDRTRWGLGFSTVAADALGAVLLLPRNTEHDTVEAGLEIGVPRLALPLALIEDNQITRLTTAWTQETTQALGTYADDPSLRHMIDTATAAPGTIVTLHGRTARTTENQTWIAIPPDDMTDRCRDLLHGLQHERLLWNATPDPYRTRIYALAAIAQHLLEGSWNQFSAGPWQTAFAKACGNLGTAAPTIRLAALYAVDPNVCAYLLTSFGTHIRNAGDNLVIELRDDAGDDPLLDALGGGEGYLSLPG